MFQNETTILEYVLSQSVEDTRKQCSFS